MIMKSYPTSMNLATGINMSTNVTFAPQVVNGYLAIPFDATVY